MSVFHALADITWLVGPTLMEELAHYVQIMTKTASLAIMSSLGCAGSAPLAFTWKLTTQLVLLAQSRVFLAK